MVSYASYGGTGEVQEVNNWMMAPFGPKELTGGCAQKGEDFE